MNRQTIRRLIVLALLATFPLGALHAQDPAARRVPPRILTEPADGDPLDIALRHVRREAPGATRSRRGGRVFERGDFDDVRVRDRVTTARTGVTSLYLRQQVNGLPIYGADLQANVDRDGRILNLHNRFVAGAARRAPPPAPGLTPAEALRHAAQALDLPVPTAPVVSTIPGGDPEWSALAPGVSADPIPMKLLYYPLDRGDIVLAYNLVIRTPDRRHWWDANVDAKTGALLSRADWIHDAASYRVAPLPLASPDEGARVLVQGVEDSIASPFGWHDTNGVAGAEFIDTRGNNALAQTDTAGTDSSPFRPSGTASLSFDFPVNFSQPTSASRSAAVTSLFYLTNVCHDIFHRYGFDEASGNFQTFNFGRGGAGNDAVIADAEDGALPGNAQFGTPPDGTAPRQEMGIGLAGITLTITAPAAVAGTIGATGSQFGPAVPAGGVAGTIVQALDQANAEGPTTTDAGTPLTNPAQIAGKIALIDRGTALFTTKIRNAQNAGAIAVIIVQNLPEPPFTMGGTAFDLTIPAIMISLADGQQIKNALAANVTGSMANRPAPDSSFDATVAVHEYGHGVTNRLTGGPANSSALSGTVPRGLGEGWSDFFALAFTAKAAHQRLTARNIGAFAFGAGGIRTRPYTSDLALNELTYAALTTRSEVHAIGELWAEALWEIYWNLVDVHGFDPNLYTGSGGNNIALRLVVDALKLQPSDPSFLDARDAILTADQAANAGLHQFILWQAFARRGLGLGATEGTTPNDRTIVQAFDVPPELDNADSDGDGVPDLIEAAFHRNALAPDAVNLPVATSFSVGADTFPAVQFTQLAGGTGTRGVDYTVNGLRYAVEVSDDLVVWRSGAADVTHASTTPGGFTETVVVRSTSPGTPQFFRVRVTRLAN